MADTPASAHELLAKLREQGAAQRDPVRLRLAEALARRAAAHEGAARRAIDDRLAALLARLADAPAPAPRASAARAPGALAALVDHAARRKADAAPRVAPSSRPAVAPPAGAKAPASAAADAGTVQFFKRTWSRLSADQRLAQSRAALPGNAGPLNSQHLVHRSLLLMRALSPEYLERFVGYVDALQWLEQANEAAAQDAANPGRAAAARRSLPARR